MFEKRRKNTCLSSERRSFIIWRTSGLSGEIKEYFRVSVVFFFCVRKVQRLLQNEMGSYHHYIQSFSRSVCCVSFDMITRILEFERCVLLLLFYFGFSVKFHVSFVFFSIGTNLSRGFTETKSIHSVCLKTIKMVCWLLTNANNIDCSQFMNGKNGTKFFRVWEQIFAQILIVSLLREMGTMALFFVLNFGMLTLRNLYAKLCFISWIQRCLIGRFWADTHFFLFCSRIC